MIIQQETERKIQSNSKFALKHEQVRGQILMQIRMALMENAEDFPISEPEIAMSKIKELCGGTPEQMLNIVVRNLVARKEFDKAKEIFDNFSKNRGNGGIIYNDLLPLRKEMRNAEIAYMVLKVINMNGTEEEETRCWELIDKGVKTGNVRLSQIPLGTSEDGLRKITLEDVWPDEGEVERIRWATGKAK